MAGCLTMTQNLTRRSHFRPIKANAKVKMAKVVTERARIRRIMKRKQINSTNLLVPNHLTRKSKRMHAARENKLSWTT